MQNMPTPDHDEYRDEFERLDWTDTVTAGEHSWNLRAVRGRKRQCLLVWPNEHQRCPVIRRAPLLHLPHAALGLL